MSTRANSNLKVSRATGFFLFAFLFPALVLARQNDGRGNSAPPQGDRDEAPSAPGQALPGGGVFRRLRELPPIQQRRFMATDPEFLSFRPRRQELIRERLREWNSLMPEQKDRIRQREEIVASLSPDQRREAWVLLPQWRDLPPERRQALTVAFRHLRDLPPGQRRAYLDSREVKENLSPHERDILEGLNGLLPQTLGAPANDPNN
jgi:hypothetical protein